MTAPTLTFKSIRQEQEWESGKLDKRLTAIYIQAAQYAFATWGWIFCVTDIYRTPAEDRAVNGHGIHPVWRAIDTRTRDVKPEEVAALSDRLNALWIYDPDRLKMAVAYVHDNGNGIHMHCQISPLSMKRDLTRGA